MNKNLKYLFSIGSLIVFISLAFITNDDPDEGDTTTKTTIVYLPHNYLNLCSSFFEGVKPLTITIAVDRYKGNGSFDVNFKTYRFKRNNTDASANFDFENIEVPKSGTFGITVTVDAGIACYECCHSNSCYIGGHPYFRGISTVYNSSSSPSTITIVPALANCF